MIISRNLLAEFYPGIKDLTLEQISEAFFKIGIEIEGFERIVPPTGIYYGVIRACEKVGGSDKLNLCRVFVPLKNQEFDIVCGASNVREGLSVVVALPGAKLANGEMEIVERTFAKWGVTSRGMICSYLELYKSNLLKDTASFDKGKIIELRESWNLGGEFRDEDFWLDDWIFDLFIPANRGDLYSAWGLSRELAKVLSVKKEGLAHGGIYSKDQDSWFLKRVLLANNQKGIDGASFEELLDRYLYLCFNEWSQGDRRPSRSKSPYFKKLRNGLALGKPEQDFAMRKIAVNSEKILAFVGLPSNWEYRGDLFVFANGFAEVPEWREDVVTDMDVASEIIVLLGWDRIEAMPIPFSPFKAHNNSQILAVEKIREFWRNWGFYECNTFNLHDRFEGEVEMRNPLSKDHCSLRSHAINELVNVLHNNHRSKRELHSVFEVFESQMPKPTWKLNVVVPEIKNAFPIGNTKIGFNLCDLQALLRKCCRYLNFNPKFSVDVPAGTSTGLFLPSPNHLCILDERGNAVGFMGNLISPISSVNLWGFVLEINWYPPKNKASAFESKYPPVYKDISISVGKDFETSLLQMTSNMSSEHLISWKLIEKYASEENINYLFRVKLQSFNGTLTGEDIQNNLQRLYSYFSSIEGVTVR